MGSYGAARVCGDMDEKMVPKSRMAGNAARQILSRDVGRKGEVRRIEVEVLGGDMLISSKDEFAFAARRVVTIVN